MRFAKFHNQVRRTISVAIALAFTTGLLTVRSARAADFDAPATQQNLPPIQIIPGDGMNLQIIDQISSHYLVVEVNTPVHNWFACALTNLPIDKEVTIGFSMAGKDSSGNKGDVTKWRGLKPVMTYADPNRYETSEWFQRDERGHWISGDPFKQGEQKLAGTGKTPEQSVIPQEIAEEFLSKDRKYWQAWREIDDTEVVTSLNIFRIRQKFAYPTATVAMRIPFTYTLLQNHLERLQAAGLPGVSVEEIGLTPDNRKLQIVRIADTATIPASERRTIVITAREHATEAASSWFLSGALADVATMSTTDPRRRGVTWLFIPIQDPDGSAQASFDRLTEAFVPRRNSGVPAEALAYARYFTDYIAAGGSLDAVISLHNVEAEECPNIFSPFIDSAYAYEVNEINRELFSDLQRIGYHAAKPNASWGHGRTTFRLYGWLADRFGALDLAYEVNDRYPPNRLSLATIQRGGGIMAEHLARWAAGPSGCDHHDVVLRRLEQHRLRREAYFSRARQRLADRTSHELLTLGY